ncbi:MAG: FAD binding domain-containing protein, partial [Fimbriimonadaceae bacterium]|nr:FAD binding domain-containing protein [Alphaproteobacteria bacterium]
MSINTAFDLAMPTSIADAIARHTANPAARYVAGGTDLIPNLRKGIGTPDLLISLEAIEEIKTVSETDDYFVIGAGVTLAELENSPLLALFPALAAVSEVAGPALREAATIGGNLCLDTR